MSELAGNHVKTFWTTTEIPWLAGRGRLSQSIRLEEKAPGGILLATIAVMVAGILAFITWAALTPVGEVASASGEVTPVGSVRRIQHLEGGIVAAVYVHEGDLVEAGQPLMVLESGSTLPELDQLRARLAGLRFRQAQLVAFQNGDVVANPDGSGVRYDELVSAQGNLLRDKRASIESQQVLLGEQVQQRQVELQSFRDQAVKVRDQLAIIAEQVDTRAGLVEKGLSPRMGLLDLKREQSRVQTQLVEIEGQISRSTRAIAEAQARVPELKTRTQRDTAEELAKLESELAEVRESMLRAQDRVERLTIRSPVRGTVKGLQTETIGGVIAPGSTVMEVIPSGVAMVVEARIQTKDIGFVKLQQPVDVKLAAYDYTRFGSAHGTVETLSATTFQDDKGTPFYRARIRLAENHLGDDPTRNTIIPGMTVMADIQTGQKTVLSYLLKPIVRAGGEALRER